LGLLIGREPPLGARRHAIGQTGHAEIVIAMHPVAQRLSVHAAQLGCLRAGAPVQHQRKRQQVAGRVGILRGVVAWISS